MDLVLSSVRHCVIQALGKHLGNDVIKIYAVKPGRVAFSTHTRGMVSLVRLSVGLEQILPRHNRLSGGSGYICTNKNVHGNPTRGIRTSCISGLRSSGVNGCKNPGTQEHCSIPERIYKSSSMCQIQLLLKPSH